MLVMCEKPNSTEAVIQPTVSLCGAGKKILQQASEEELFGECSKEKKNGDREWCERLHSESGGA